MTGSVRMMHIVKLLVAMEFKVTFLATEWHGSLKHENYLRFLGVEPLHNTEEIGFETHRRNCGFDIIMIARRNNYARYGEYLKKHCPMAMYIFDTGNLCFF
jgi:hypothetical protein